MAGIQIATCSEMPVVEVAEVTRFQGISLYRECYFSLEKNLRLEPLQPLQPPKTTPTTTPPSTLSSNCS
jgi:hypothetical protein